MAVWASAFSPAGIMPARESDSPQKPCLFGERIVIHYHWWQGMKGCVGRAAVPKERGPRARGAPTTARRERDSPKAHRQGHGEGRDTQSGTRMPRVPELHPQCLRLTHRPGARRTGAASCLPQEKFSLEALSFLWKIPVVLSFIVIGGEGGMVARDTPPFPKSKAPERIVSTWIERHHIQRGKDASTEIFTSLGRA